MLPEFGKRPIETIRRPDVAAFHSRLGRHHPYLANRVLAMLSHMFNWGERVGLLPDNHPNPARGLPRFPEPSRERWLSAEEVRRIFQALEKEQSLYVQGFIWLSLLTGCRKGELLSAKWVDADLERGILRLPKTKSGRIHYIPLSTRALAVLDALPKDVLDALPKEKGNPHVFPGVVPGSHLVDLHRPWARIRKAAGVDDVRLHDLRRTVGSWMAQRGASLPLIGSVLNHSSPATTQVYARLAEDNRRDALEEHGQALLAAAESRSRSRR